MAEILKRNRPSFIAIPSSLFPGGGGGPEDVGREEVRGLPVAYILGKKEFWSLEFRGHSGSAHSPARNRTPGGDIPGESKGQERQERSSRWGAVRARSLVSLARALGGGKVLRHRCLSDALGVARQNARRYEVADRILFLRGDLLLRSAGQEVGGKNGSGCVQSSVYSSSRDPKSAP